MDVPSMPSYTFLNVISLAVMELDMMCSIRVEEDSNLIPLLKSVLSLDGGLSTLTCCLTVV